MDKDVKEKNLTTPYELSDETLEHVLNVLRRGTVTWSARNKCLNKGRRARKVGVTKTGKDKCVWERQCDGCGEWYDLKDGLLEVDHRDPVGAYKGDIKDYVLRMYCHEDNLQALCLSCHSRKSAGENSARRFERKIRPEDVL